MVHQHAVRELSDHELDLVSGGGGERSSFTNVFNANGVGGLVGISALNGSLNNIAILSNIGLGNTLGQGTLL
jgi:hypothetical protein